MIGAGVADWALAGVRVREAPDPVSVRVAWDSLGDDVSVVLLTEAAAAVLDTELAEAGTRLVAVIPS